MWFYPASYRILKAAVFLLMPVLLSCTDLSQTLLLEDGFERLPLGYISSSEASELQYRYVAGTGQSGPWSVSTFGMHQEYHKAWEIVRKKDSQFLRQNAYLVDEGRDLLKRHIHPVIVAGDSLWHDYKVEFSFSPDQVLDKCGLVFRYRDDQRYYFYGMEGNRLVLKMRDGYTAPGRPYEEVLASVPFCWREGAIYKGEVSVKQNRIYTLLNDSLSMVAEDALFKRGKVGFLSDVQADFYSMKVTTLKREKRKLNRYLGQISNKRAMRINENPNPVLWKKIDVQGAGRNVRFGDLNADGNADILIGHTGGQEGGTESCGIVGLTAINLEGEVLWETGHQPLQPDHCQNETALQIHDLDGDGLREVITVIDGRVSVFEGRKGHLKRRKVLSEIALPGHPKGSLSPDRLLFCDLHGSGRDSDMILMAAGSVIWAYDDRLDLLWSATGDFGTGNPFAKDLDGDGMDEILAGYTLIDEEGSTVWSLNKEAGDPATASIAITMGMPEDTALKYVFGAGYWGTMIFGQDTTLLQHQSVGYVQNLSIAEYRPDIQGLEMVSANFWGSQGVINLYDSDGRIYRSFEHGSAGSMCLPVNWRGDGISYFLLNTHHGDGGLFNGDGNLVVVLPDDGHPYNYHAVLDLQGDRRDEIITWNDDQIWIYTQVDNPRKTNVRGNETVPLYNYSNHNVHYAIPR